MGDAGAGDAAVGDAGVAEVWVADDDESIRWVLQRALTRSGLAVRTFGDARSVLSALDAGRCPSVLVSDIRMPGGLSGIDLLQTMRVRCPQLPVVIMTAYSDLDSAVSSFQAGAFEYLPKPFDVARAIELIRRAGGAAACAAAAPSATASASASAATATSTTASTSAAASASDRAPSPGAPPQPRDLLGQAPAMQDVFRAIGRLSQSAATVLITGESGTGKELIAQALHQHGSRARKPFVALNMAAIPRELLESELFGHERGAFTGAQTQRLGRFEQADGGTLFLDEIGDMPAEMQTRLLRVLSDGRFFRVGGHQPVRCDVRIIAATHQDLEQRVRQGAFREDLLHRLNVIRLRLPPLRERTEDIALLAQRFLARSARELGGEPKWLAPDALALLRRFDWPGNVRQLENVCHWIGVMAPMQQVAARDLPPDLVAAVMAGRPQPRAAAAAAAAAAGHEAVGVTGVTGAAGSVAPVGAAGTIGSAGVTGAVGAAAFPAGFPADLPTGSSTTAPDEALHPGAPGTAYAAMSGTSHAALSAGTAHVAPPDPPHGARRDAAADPAQWLVLLDAQARRLLAGPGGDGTVMAQLSRAFESTVIRAALARTNGRRVDAAARLGIGRNTITRKIQELGLDDDPGGG